MNTSGPVATEAGRSKAFPCDQCGGELQFTVDVQTLACPYCGNAQALDAEHGAAVEEQDLDAMLARLSEVRDAGRHDEEGFREITCDACAGTSRFSGTLESSECVYCGVPLQSENAHAAEHRVPVDGVLPFRIDRRQAMANLRAWVKKLWFAPGKFIQRGVRGKFQGVYLPFWTFDAMTDVQFVGQRGDHYYVTEGSGDNKRRVRKTRWRTVSGAFRRFFDDVTVNAGTGLHEKRIAALEPWPFEDLKPFDPALLAGFVSRTYDIELPDGFRAARGMIDEAIRAEVRGRIGGDVQRIQKVDAAYGALTFKHLLLPVWMLTYRFKNKAYHVLVNAATGEVQADRPYSILKIALAVIAVLAAVGIFALIRSQTG